MKVKPGERVTVTFRNEGSAPHTFTSRRLHVDRLLAPGKSARFTVTVPRDARVFQFHCRFHESAGMQGAFYTSAGRATPSRRSTETSSTTTSGAVPGY